MKLGIRTEELAVDSEIYPATEAIASYYPKHELWPKELKIRLVLGQSFKTQQMVYKWTARYAGNPTKDTANNSQVMAPRGEYQTRENAIRYAKRRGWIVGD